MRPDHPEQLIVETGRLVRGDSGFELKRDGGGVYSLLLSRVPVDCVEKQVRVSGFKYDDHCLDVEAIVRI